MKSGTAMELCNRFSEWRRHEWGGGGVCGGGGGGAGYERWMTPLVREFGGGPKKIFEFKMSVEAILMHFEAFLSCHTKLILQA